MDAFELTVVTPTTGRPSLFQLIDSIAAQQPAARIQHVLLWDDYRDPAAPDPASLSAPDRLSLVLPPGFGRFGDAPGSALRAIGLLLARTPWVTFADDDVYWALDHAAALAVAVRGVHWASTLRHVWSPAGELLGVDRFESVGDDPGRGTPYEMCDNNCMVFRRELGVVAAPLYRETTAYNDDRLMYAFLKAKAGPRGRTGRATVHQVCPPRLEGMFRAHASRE